jgi:DNA-directed RNA polymerase specialized sigma24 family protein
MSELTSLSMRDARDAEDKRLLEAGDIELLLAGWYETIVRRCVAKMRGPVGHDVAQAVSERLWKQLKQGKYHDGKLPFRVIVHQRIGWTCDGWYEPGWREDEWLDVDTPTPDDALDVDTRLDLESFVETLPPADGEVARLWLFEGLDPAEIAVRLVKNPNAVYQALSRNRARLREWLET